MTSHVKTLRENGQTVLQSALSGYPDETRDKSRIHTDHLLLSTQGNGTRDEHSGSVVPQCSSLPGHLRAVQPIMIVFIHLAHCEACDLLLVHGNCFCKKVVVITLNSLLVVKRQHHVPATRHLLMT